MKVLEILNEEAPKDLDGKPLNIDNDEEEKALNIDNDEEEKALNIDNDKKKELKKPVQVPLNGNWQTKAFSQDAWYLIFHTANMNDWARRDKFSSYKADLKYWYKRVVGVADNPPGSPTTIWVGKADRLPHLSLQTMQVEDIIAELIGRIQNTVGVTLGPSWVFNPEDPNVKPNYKEFWKRHGTIMGASAKVSTFGKADNQAVTAADRANQEPLTVEAAANLAAKIAKAFDAGGFWDFQYTGRTSPDLSIKILELVMQIKVDQHFDQVAVEFKKITRGDDLMSELQGNWGQGLTKADKLKLDKHLKLIGKGADTDQSNIGNWTDKRPSLVIDDQAVLKKELELLQAKFEKQYPRIIKWEKNKNGAPRSPFEIAYAYNKNLNDAISKEWKADIAGQITMGKLMEIYKANMLAYIKVYKELE